MATPWRRRWRGRLFAGRRRRSCWSGWRNRHRKRPPGGKPSPFYRWETGDRAEPVWFGPVSDYGDGEGEAWPGGHRRRLPALPAGRRGPRWSCRGLPVGRAPLGHWVPPVPWAVPGSPGKRGLFRRGNLLLRRLCADGGVVLAGEVEQGVDGIVLVPHLKVAVGPSGPPGRAHRSDGLTLGDGIPHLDQELGAVGVVGQKSVPVGEDDQIAVGSLLPGEDHRAVRGGVDGGARRRPAMSSPRWKLFSPKMKR